MTPINEEWLPKDARLLPKEGEEQATLFSWAKLQGLVRVHEDQESGSGGEESKKKLRKKCKHGAGRSGEEGKNYLVSFIFGVGLGYLLLFFYRLIQLIQ